MPAAQKPGNEEWQEEKVERWHEVWQAGHGNNCQDGNYPTEGVKILPFVGQGKLI
jgi:hypothetical protein